MFETLLSGGKRKIIPNGQRVWETSGSFVVPADVTLISAVAVGKGGSGSTPGYLNYQGGGGGALSYRNDIPVTPGETLTITFGTTFVTIFRGGTVLLRANYANGRVGGTINTTGGATSFAGGTAPAVTNTVNGRNWVGGAGAAGYTAKGADAPMHPSPPSSGNTPNDVNGITATGGGGGSATSGAYLVNGSSYSTGNGGGGVGLLGLGANGTGGIAGVSLSNGNGKGGSGGENGTYFSGSWRGTGKYGAGANPGNDSHAGGPAGVRIIWGTGRKFPSTLTGNL